MKKESKKKEKFREIYEIEKDGKEKIVETKGMIKEEKVKREDVAKENKSLKIILIIIGILLVGVILISIIKSPPSKFEYKGMTFNVIQEGKLTFYQTAFKVLYKEKITNYNIYLRNDPRKLEKNVPFNGELNLENFIVLNTTTENLFCEGDWSLAIGNMQNLEIFDTKIMTDANASCDSMGDYMFVQIEEGNETSIEQYGPSCYKLKVANCEILPVTERFMIETFVKFNIELAK